MYVGESERKVRELFKRAKESAPALIFFDEFDSLSMVPSAAGLTSRINSQIILELDSLQNTQVFILAASNRVELVDPALLRSGRIDRVLHIPFHADLRSRTETFEALTRNFKFDGQISMAEIAKVYQYSSGAQIYARCARAWIKAARRGINELSEVAVKLEDFY